jgi:hypothetical protein
MVLEFKGTILPDGHISVPPEMVKKINKIKNFNVFIISLSEVIDDQREAKKELKKLRGKVKWEGDIDKMREGRFL